MLIKPFPRLLSTPPVPATAALTVYLLKLNNLASTINPQQLAALSARMHRLAACQAAPCRVGECAA